MRKYISVVFILTIIISILCGCGNNTNNDILSIPRKGQQYHKRIVYISKDTDVDSTFLYDYLIISDSRYDSNTSKSFNTSVAFDKNANMIFDGGEDEISSFVIINEKIITTNSDNKYYLTDIKSGEKEEFFAGYKPLDYKNGYWSVSNENSKCGIIDEKGKEVIPCKYDTISTFDNKGYALIGDYEEQKFGMVNKNNELVIPINYKYLIPFNARINGIYSNLYIQNDITYDYTLVSDSEENVFSIDRVGNKVFDISNSEYKPISGVSTYLQNIIPIEKDNLCGYIDMLGNEVIPTKYNKIAWDFINGYSCVSIGSNYGVINAKDEEILPFDYYSITPFDQKGLAIAKLDSDSENLVIDLAGNVAYTTNNSIYAIGGGYFKEYVDDSSKMEIIQITTDSGKYETYTPKEFEYESEFDRLWSELQ